MADIVALPIKANSSAQVVGTHLPMQTPEDRDQVVAEALRVLVPGGTIRLHCTSGGGELWLPILAAGGVGTVTMDGIHATGVKP